MKGNFHVRFLGEGAVAMPFPYPTVMMALPSQHLGSQNSKPSCTPTFGNPYANAFLFAVSYSPCV